MSRHVRLFRRFVRLLFPGDFRADYESEMTRTFGAQEREARRQGWPSLLALWWETLGDLLRTAPREHVEQLARDASYAARDLRRRPGAAAAAIATLAVGVGSVTAIASVVNGVDWRPLGYPDPDRVVFVGERFQGQVLETTGYATFADWRDRSAAFVALAAMSGSTVTLSGVDENEQLNGIRVTPDFFRAVGVEPALGRGFTAAENRWENRRFVVLSARLWHRRFASDPGVVGREIQLSGRPYVVTGVMPEGFEDLVADRVYQDAEYWAPLGYDPSLSFACRTCRHLRVIGRLREGVTVARAQAEIEAITGDLAREHADAYSDPGARVTRVSDALLGPVRPALYLLLAAVGVLLTIATLNVANLLLVRAVERRPEIAVRQALGVAAGRLVRQLLTESLVLATAGAALGVGVAFLALKGLVAVAPAGVPRIAEVALDGRVLALTVLVTAGTGFLFGLVPAWHLAATDVVSALRGGRTPVGGGGRAGRVLVAANVALAVVLLAVTALLGGSFLQLLRVNPGFDPEGVVTASISLAGPAYAEQEASLAFYRELLPRVARRGDVAALTTQIPTEDNDSAGFHIVGRMTANPEDAPSADRFAVTPDYFRALGIPLLRGRGITHADRATSPRVAVVNETIAAQLFAGEDPIGQRVFLGGVDEPPWEVVGIAGDVRHHGLDEPASYQVYIPVPQFYDWPMRVVLRTGDAPAAAVGRIRSAVSELDRSQAVYRVRTLDSVLSDTLAERRFLLWLIGGFASAALLLSVIGLYGVVSYVVAQRRRDIGLRLALGAGAGAIRRHVLAIGLAPVAAGLTAGLVLTAAFTGPLEGMLFAVGRLDARMLAAAAGVLLTCALAACYLPARRATRVDPVAALRAE